jgi:hypothetical protein
MKNDTEMYWLRNFPRSLSTVDRNHDNSESHSQESHRGQAVNLIREIELSFVESDHPFCSSKVALFQTARSRKELAIDTFLPAPLASERALRDLRFSLTPGNHQLYLLQFYIPQSNSRLLCLLEERGCEFRGGYSQTYVRSQTFIVGSKIDELLNLRT